MDAAGARKAYAANSERATINALKREADRAVRETRAAAALMRETARQVRDENREIVAELGRIRLVEREMDAVMGKVVERLGLADQAITELREMRARLDVMDARLEKRMKSANYAEGFVDGRYAAGDRRPLRAVDDDERS